MNVDLGRIYNADVLGEFLRSLTFVSKGPLDLGCYSSFELQEGFVKIEDPKDLENISHELMAPASEISAYLHPQMSLVVAWYWDGDGSLLFEVQEGSTSIVVINQDCKKKHGWSFCEVT